MINFELRESSLDALACWGNKHGPAILINQSEQSTGAHHFGRNSSLAHEICHLLLDRNSTLPVSEVLNGNTPERLEKRARAFAAELLLPRATASQEIRHDYSLEQSVNQLSGKFGASPQLVAWQIINADDTTTLTADEQYYLNNLSKGR